MSDIYEVTLKMEVLREFAASIHASYSRYMDKHGIDIEDETNPVNLNDSEIFAAKDSILLCNTLDELKVYEIRLKELRDEIKRLEEEDECEEKGWRTTLRASSH